MSDSSATGQPGSEGEGTAGDRFSCPKCGTHLSRKLVAKLDQDSRFSFVICPQPGSLMMAKTIAGTIDALAKTVRSIDRRTVLMVEGMTTSQEDGAVTISFLCARSPAVTPDTETPISNADETT